MAKTTPELSESQKTVRAKRRSSSQEALRNKAERGDLHGNERALVRVGKRNTKILIGEEDLEDWDEEELIRGQRKSKNGTFTGRRPKVVPVAVHDELVRRKLDEAADLLRENLLSAVTVLTEIVNDPEAEDKDRLKAVSMVLDRVMGKTPEKVQFSGNAKWMVALEGGIVAAGSNEETETGSEDND